MRNRRYAVPFDPEFFARRSAAGEDVSPLAAFRHAYATNHWAGLESPSGFGASLNQTAAVRRALPPLCQRLGIGTLLDLPCGDCSWISTIDLGDVRYIGADFLPELVEANERRYAHSGGDFRVLDLLSSLLPAADLVLCRDCLVHLSFADIARAISSLRASRGTYLLTTTFPGQPVNEDVVTGDWRPLNLEAAPFLWPPPCEVLVEGCTEANGLFADKSLGLWRIDALPEPAPSAPR
ncbi:MAG TPA: class I SAM-dependent methyltransferase [Gemmatimonadaceae bacterium]|nr:class I SAM-dependent methyltransferase [Gemmatimonadaceae bacterium]